jgi:hypothetical protein
MELALNNTVSLHFSVYTGDCDALTCAGNQFFGFFPLVFDTVEGEVYSIFVYGREYALTDTFGIIAHEVERPNNDQCTTATLLELNKFVSGSTSASSTELGLEFCHDQCGEFYGG